MRLNRSTSHAIRILVDCARADGRLVKVADVARRVGLTDQNAFKIVHLLSRAELISAVRGRHGGVRLARPATTIRIGDVVRAMESTDLELTGGVATRADKSMSAGVNKVFDDAFEAFISILDQHTVADLAADGAKATASAGPTADRGAPHASMAAARTKASRAGRPPRRPVT